MSERAHMFVHSVFKGTPPNLCFLPFNLGWPWRDGYTRAIPKAGNRGKKMRSFLSRPLSNETEDRRKRTGLLPSSSAARWRQSFLLRRTTRTATITSKLFEPLLPCACARLGQRTKVA